jgi:hypothetical protein
MNDVIEMLRAVPVPRELAPKHSELVAICEMLADDSEASLAEKTNAKSAGDQLWQELLRSASGVARSADHRAYCDAMQATAERHLQGDAVASDALQQSIEELVASLAAVSPPAGLVDAHEHLVHAYQEYLAALKGYTAALCGGLLDQAVAAATVVEETATEINSLEDDLVAGGFRN